MKRYYVIDNNEGRMNDYRSLNDAQEAAEDIIAEYGYDAMRNNEWDIENGDIVIAMAVEACWYYESTSSFAMWPAVELPPLTAADPDVEIERLRYRLDEALAEVAAAQNVVLHSGSF